MPMHTQALTSTAHMERSAHTARTYTHTHTHTSTTHAHAEILGCSPPHIAIHRALGKWLPSWPLHLYTCGGTIPPGQGDPGPASTGRSVALQNMRHTRRCGSITGSGRTAHPSDFPDLLGTKPEASADAVLSPGQAEQQAQQKWTCNCGLFLIITGCGSAAVAHVRLCTRSLTVTVVCNLASCQLQSSGQRSQDLEEGLPIESRSLIKRGRTC